MCSPLLRTTVLLLRPPVAAITDPAHPARHRSDHPHYDHDEAQGGRKRLDERVESRRRRRAHALYGHRGQVGAQRRERRREGLDYVGVGWDRCDHAREVHDREEADVRALRKVQLPDLGAGERRGLYGLQRDAGGGESGRQDGFESGREPLGRERVHFDEKHAGQRHLGVCFVCEDQENKERYGQRPPHCAPSRTPHHIHARAIRCVCE